jgi:hypothetical protein
MGMKLAQEWNIQTLTMLGDSEIIIKELRGMSHSTKDPLKSICLAINSLNFFFKPGLLPHLAKEKLRGRCYGEGSQKFGTEPPSH